MSTLHDNPFRPDHDGGAPEPKADSFFDPMVRTMNRNLLKHSAGTAIFCPRCQQVADARRWVVASANSRTVGLCVTCWDRTVAKSPAADLALVEVIDGRVLFARPKRAKTAAQEMKAIAKLPKSRVEGP